MTTVVISQPFLFPWVGLFEQLRQADVFVHYDDVAFSKGSFVNRVQIKGAGGTEWMTIPLRARRFGQSIQSLQAEDDQAWRTEHLARLAEFYDQAPFRDEMLALVGGVYADHHASFCELLITALERLAHYFGLAEHTRFYRSSDLGIGGSSSARVLDIVRSFGGDRYVTGHGAKNYLDHEAFERAGVAVDYLDYSRRPYPQLHGPFDPHVSTLDLLANLGPVGRDWICSPTIPWRSFLRREADGRVMGGQSVKECA